MLWHTLIPPFVVFHRICLNQQATMIPPDWLPICLDTLAQAAMTHSQPDEAMSFPPSVQHSMTPATQNN